MAIPFTITTQLIDGSEVLKKPERFTAYTLSCGETGEYIRVIPQFGGILHQLVLRKEDQLVSLLKTPATAPALLADESYASAFLFPFASRIPHGKYSFEGNRYVLPVNELGTSNAIHGLVHRQPFAVIRQEITHQNASLTLQHVYEGKTDGYPFPFTFTVTYVLSREQLPEDVAHGSSAGPETCILRIQYTVCNTGEQRCPVGFGWHPYFRLGSHSVDELFLTLPARSPVILNDDLQPCGYQSAEAPGTLRLHSRQLDNVFAMEDAKNRFSKTILANEADTRLIIEQETGRNKMGFLVCYTPPERDCIAIEPLTANVNAFNNGDGLTVLDPGGELTGVIQVRLA